MITEKDTLKEIKLKNLETLLLKQHYPERIIKAGIDKALEILQNELTNVKEKKRRSYFLFQLLIQTTPKPLKILKTSDRIRNTLKRVKFVNCK